MEINFWKFYRNKYLNKIIYSNFEFSNIYSYDRLYNVSEILSKYTNGNEILKDKVKNNQYLFFEIKITGIRETFPNLILELIKKDELFYNQLFGNNEYYSKNFNFNELFIKIIQSSNLVALKSFIKLIYKKNKNKINKFNDNFKVFNYKSLKMLKYIITIGGGDKLLKNLEYNDLELFNNSFKLKHLIEILKFSSQTMSSNNQINKEILESNLFTNQLKKLSINEILEEYSSILNNKQQQPEIKFKILELINLFYLIINKNENEKPLNYYILFKNENEIENKIYRDLNDDHQHQEQQQRQYGYFFNLFKYKSEKLNQLISNLLKRIEQNPNSNETTSKREEIFEYLINSFILSSNNIQLLDKVIKENNSINFYEKYKSITFSRILSIEILNYFFENYQDLFFNDLNLNWINIESIEVFKHYKLLMKSLNRNLSIAINDSNYQIELIPNQFKTVSKNFKKPGQLFLDLLFNYNNNNHLKEILNLDLFKELIYNSLNYYNKQDSFIEILKTFKIKSSSFDFSLIENENHNNYKIIKWLFSKTPTTLNEFKNSKKEIIINQNLKINSINNEQLFISLFKIGYYKEIFQLLDNNQISRMNIINFHFPGNSIDTKYYIKYITVEYIDYLFNFIFKNKIEIMQLGYHSKKFNWETFINEIMRNGNLLIFKHLIKNYGGSFIINSQLFNLEFKEFYKNK
ncbi:hypothetical protein ACTFIR_009686 [Dictyostelium discoideum]